MVHERRVDDWEVEVSCGLCHPVGSNLPGILLAIELESFSHAPYPS